MCRFCIGVIYLALERLTFFVCYNKSAINQATTKAMLTQMISIVFMHMESEEQVFAFTQTMSGMST